LHQSAVVLEKEEKTGGNPIMEQKRIYDDVIQFAIGNEQAAADLYADLAGRTEHRDRRVFFDELADMERGHKSKLEKLDTSYFASQELKPPQDLKISDYLVDVKLEPGSSYQDILLFASKQEKAAFELYTDLAGVYASIPEIQRMFEVLAQEESQHKLRLEREYDDHVYQED